MKTRDYLIAFVVLCLFIVSLFLFMNDHWIWGTVLGLPSFFLLVAFLTELTKTAKKEISTTSEITDNQQDIVPSLLELVKIKGSIVVDSYVDNQYSKNRIGWYLNSYKFIEDYKDNYIAEVDFFDNERRTGDIKRIILKLNPNPQPVNPNDEPHIYKSSQIKQLFIKGLEYRDLTDDDLGKFYGYVKTEPDNKFDKYAIAIFDDKHRHIGYVPKGEEYLFNTLELIGGKQQAWGYIYKELHTYSGDETLKGNVYIPVKCSVAKIEKAISEFKTKRPRKIVKI